MINQTIKLRIQKKVFLLIIAGMVAIGFIVGVELNSANNDKVESDDELKNQNTIGNKLNIHKIGIYHLQKKMVAVYYILFHITAWFKN